MIGMSGKVKRLEKPQETPNAAIQDSDAVLRQSSVVIEVVLESGERVRFDMAREFRHVTHADSDAVSVEAIRATAQFAFWAAQLARAEAAVRRAADALRLTAAQCDLAYRTDPNSRTYTEGGYRSLVRASPTVLDARRKLRDARRQRDMIRGVVDGLRHRCFLLTALLRKRAESPEGM